MKRGATIASVLGGLLLAASFVAPALGFEFPAFIPGVVLLFIGRAVRRSQRDGIPGTTTVPTDPRPAPKPEPPPQRAPEPKVERREPVLRSPARSRLEEILGDFDEGTEPEESLQTEVAMDDFEFESGTHLSSTEMIARARSRWDRKI